MFSVPSFKNDVLVLNDKDAILYSVLMNKSGLKKKYNTDNIITGFF